MFRASLYIELGTKWPQSHQIRFQNVGMVNVKQERVDIKESGLPWCTLFLTHNHTGQSNDILRTRFRTMKPDCSLTDLIGVLAETKSLVYNQGTKTMLRWCAANKSEAMACDVANSLLDAARLFAQILGYHHKYFFFHQNNGYVTPQTIYFHY